MLKNFRTLSITIVMLLINSIAFTGCKIDTRDNYGLDKDNPVAVEVWHYYNGIQKYSLIKL